MNVKKKLLSSIYPLLLFFTPRTVRQFIPFSCPLLSTHCTSPHCPLSPTCFRVFFMSNGITNTFDRLCPLIRVRYLPVGWYRTTFHLLHPSIHTLDRSTTSTCDTSSLRCSFTNVRVMVKNTRL